MKAIRFLLGILLLPVAVSVSRTAWFLVTETDAQGMQTIIPMPLLALSGGFVVWLACCLFLPRPVVAYIFAHELTHALWAILFGASVRRIRVGKKGGSVAVSKGNVFIILAPYFFPLYAVMVIVAYYLLALFFDMRPYIPAWLALTGAAWGFHITFTLQTLFEGQPDISIYGRLFSYVLIYTLNLLGIALWCVLISNLSLETFASRLMRDFSTTAAWCQAAGKWLIVWAIGKRSP